MLLRKDAEPQPETLPVPLFHAGTSGWSYPQWRGRFYPEHLKDKDRLAFYAQHFNAVEINTTFYRLPDREIARRWADAVPGHFRFCCKVWQKITHQDRLAGDEDELKSFLSALAPLKTQAGPLLIQLPPRMDRAALPALERTLRLIREKDWQAAVEFRDPSWYAEDVFAALDTLGAAVVLHDMPAAPCAKTNAGAGFVYIRCHGIGGSYRGGYSTDFLNAIAARTRQWTAERREVYAFFNNTLGEAPENAAYLHTVTAG